MLVLNHADDRGYDLAAVDYCSGGAAVPYTYAPATHRLASVGGTPRSHDANGNTQTGIASLTLGYDARNRLATAVNGAITTTYGYNGRGERVSKQASTGGFGQVPTQYAYDESGHLLGDYTGGTAQSEYVYLDDWPIAVVKANVVSYIKTDHLGSPRQVVNPTTNQPLWTWDFLGNAFGADAPNESPGGGAAYTLNLRFPGQYYDAETGLNYNYFRDYESATGRYVESDPIGLGDGPSIYAYVKSRPLFTYDPFGLATYIGFPPDKRQDMERAVQDAIDTVRGCKKFCQCWPGAEAYCGDDQDSQAIAANLGGAEFRYSPQQASGYCAEVRGSSIIVYPSAFTGQCCKLASVLAHEANHVGRFGGRGTENRSFFLEDVCFGCKHYGK